MSETFDDSEQYQPLPKFYLCRPPPQYAGSADLHAAHHGAGVQKPGRFKFVPLIPLDQLPPSLHVFGVPRFLPISTLEEAAAMNLVGVGQESLPRNRDGSPVIYQVQVETPEIESSVAVQAPQVKPHSTAEPAKPVSTDTHNQATISIPSQLSLQFKEELDEYQGMATTYLSDFGAPAGVSNSHLMGTYTSPVTRGVVVPSIDKSPCNMQSTAPTSEPRKTLSEWDGTSTPDNAGTSRLVGDPLLQMHWDDGQQTPQYASQTTVEAIMQATREKHEQKVNSMTTTTRLSTSGESMAPPQQPSVIPSKSCVDQVRIQEGATPVENLSSASNGGTDYAEAFNVKHQHEASKVNTVVRASVPERHVKPPQFCRYWIAFGICKFGDKCHFEHLMPSDLRTMRWLGLEKLLEPLQPNAGSNNNDKDGRKPDEKVMRFPRWWNVACEKAREFGLDQTEMRQAGLVMANTPYGGYDLGMACPTAQKHPGGQKNTKLSPLTGNWISTHPRLLKISQIGKAKQKNPQYRKRSVTTEKLLFPQSKCSTISNAEHRKAASHDLGASQSVIEPSWNYDTSVGNLNDVSFAPCKSGVSAISDACTITWAGWGAEAKARSEKRDWDFTNPDDRDIIFPGKWASLNSKREQADSRFADAAGLKSHGTTGVPKGSSNNDRVAKVKLQHSSSKSLNGNPRNSKRGVMQPDYNGSKAQNKIEPTSRGNWGRAKNRANNSNRGGGNTMYNASRGWGPRTNKNQGQERPTSEARLRGWINAVAVKSERHDDCSPNVDAAEGKQQGWDTAATVEAAEEDLIQFDEEEDDHDHDHDDGDDDDVAVDDPEVRETQERLDAGDCADEAPTKTTTISNDADSTGGSTSVSASFPYQAEAEEGCRWW